MDESLTADRLDRIHQVLHGKKASDVSPAASSDVSCIWEWLLVPWPLQDLAEEFDHELSRWLVDMEGPIRESSRMLEAMAE